MKQAVVQVFHEHLADMTPRGGKYLVTRYTSLEHTDVLTSTDQIGLQAVVDVVAATADVPLTVAVEHSANGNDWRPKSSTPELSGSIAASGKAVTLVGGELRPVRPSQRFVRLRIDVGDAVWPFAVTVKLYVSARGRELQPEPEVLPVPGRHTRAALLLGVEDRTLRELRDLVLGSQHLEGPARHDEVLRGMSAPARQDVARFVGRIQGLDTDSRKLLVGIAEGIIRLLSMSDGEASAEPGEPPRCAACSEAGEPDTA